MKYFELSVTDISDLGDGDLRELIGRLCEAELLQQGVFTAGVLWGGAQEAADGGLDVSVSVTDSLKKPDFVPRTSTGFQVKKHTMSKATCMDEMLENGAIKPIIAELAGKNGAYIIVSGKDDCSVKMLQHRLDGMTAAIASLGNKSGLKLDFYGRDRVLQWLRKHPGVSLWARHKLGKPLSGWQPYGRWTAIPTTMKDDLLVDDHPCVFPANSPSKEPITLLEGVKLVRDKLRTGGSAVRITGLSGVGKSRFAQALFENKVGKDALPHASAIYADLGDDLSPSASELVSFLVANDIAAYLVLDNCPPDVHRMLQLKVTSSGTKLRLLTIEYDISDDKPEETEVIHLEPASEKMVSTLVQRRFPNLGNTNSDKIAEFSNGNARVALALASRVEADETLSNFSDQELFQRLFSQRKGTSDSLLESAEVLSLAYSFNTSDAEFNDELSTLGRIASIDRRELHRHQAELLRRQIAQKRGNWRAVLPHALANRLARRSLENLTIPQINAELFKPENKRIFTSCAHRIGYLHDCDAAKDLAESWIAAGAPLNDVSECTPEQLVCLGYIAPVFPDKVLSTLEFASAKAEFATRHNPSFTKIVRLLCQLAYDDKSFDRAVDLILKFAETETAAENNNSIINQLKHLFSLYLSGTEASPSRRQTFVAKLLRSPNPRHHEIATDLLNSALEASHWSSFATFDFGARRRGSGWRPATNGDKLGWYTGFIAILSEVLQSHDASKVNTAKKIISSHFRGLWSFAGCFDALEGVVRAYAKEGAWPNLWIAIKNTIHFDGKDHEPALLDRLKSLEALAAPSDPFSEMEAYVLCNTWDHAELKGGNYAVAVQEVNEKIVKLGELACSDPTYIERLGERLFDKHVDAILSFGRGLARGSRDKAETFEFLVGLVNHLPLERIHPTVFAGFIREAHNESPHLARVLQERVLEERKLKEHFVDLLCAAPLEPWGTKQLIHLAYAGELDAWAFSRIGLGRNHEAISDEDLAELIDAISRLSNGLSVALGILGMRFFIDKESNYWPSGVILSAGLKLIKTFAKMHRDDVRLSHVHGFDRVCEFCLEANAPTKEVSEITELVFDGIESFRLYSSELGDLISPLMRNFPERVLDCVFRGGATEKLRCNLVFRDKSYGSREPSLNDAPIDRVLAWCGDDQEKIIKIAHVIYPYDPVHGGEHSLDNPTKVAVSNHMMAILDAALDKLKVVEVIFARTWPSGWSGSLADILETRTRAFAVLADYPSADVQSVVAAKLKELEQAVRDHHESEAQEHIRREQRFE